MSHVAIVERPIDAAALLSAVSAAGRGAAVLFVGTVREVNAGRAVRALDYRAYEGMAAAELSRIVDEALAQWTGSAIAVEHRLGALALGDAAVVVAAAHPHRAEAFEACRYVIEQLKQRVPIWKREHYVDGPAEWVEVTA